MIIEPLSAALNPSDASVAILFCPTEESVYLQHRDRAPGIFYPDYLSCFGGAIDEGENESDAIHRELGEEIGLTGLPSSDVFSTVSLNFGCFGKGVVTRYYFVFEVSGRHLNQLTVCEGQGMVSVTRADVFGTMAARIAPYDLFVLHQFFTRPGLGCAEQV